MTTLLLAPLLATAGFGVLCGSLLGLMRMTLRRQAMSQVRVPASRPRHCVVAPL